MAEEYDVEKMEKQRQLLFDLLERVVKAGFVSLGHNQSYRAIPIDMHDEAEQLIIDIKNGDK